MGKRSPSRDGSRSPKRRKDEGVSERGRSRSRSSSGRSRSSSRSRSPSSSRSRSPSSSRSRSRSRSRGDRRRRPSPRRSRSRSRSRGERRRPRSRSRSRDDRRYGGGRGRSPPRRGYSPPRRPRSPPRRGAGENGARADRPARGAGAGDPPAAAAEPAAPEAPRERKALTAGPAGGVYIPPFKLAQMMAEVQDRESAQYQRMTWDALRKSINGLVNKVNASNIKHILPEVFAENLVRGRGLFCRSIMKSQMASPTFTPVYAALVAVVNTKFPELGELLLHRVVTQFKRSYKRNDKPVCTAAIKFIAHLANQQVVHEVLPLEVLLLLLETPSDDGVEVAVDFIKEVGPLLEDLAPQGLQTIMDRLRSIMSEGDVGKRTQYIIEGLFSLRKAKWSGKVPVDEELELVETEDQITHEISLEDKLDPQMNLDVFKEDPDFAQHEEEYAAIKREILGEESEEEEEESSGGEGGSGSEEEESSEDEEEAAAKQDIQDRTQTNLVNLRRTIYLTIMSALDFEEAGHKLLKMGIPDGQEMELATMIIECSSNEKTFIKYYALLAERFCKLKREYSDCFSEAFVRQYQLIHRLETNKLRNTAKLFAHLLSTDSIPWAVLQVIRLTEDDTTSSSRIFIKILFQELAETLGLVALNRRLNDPTCQDWFDGVFPKDSPRNMRFSINFFTSIGLGGLTDRMREILKNLPKMLAAQQAAAAAAAQGSSDSSSSSDSDSDSSSDSDSDSDSSSSSGSSSSGSSGSSGSDSDSSSSSGSGSSSSSSESESEGEGERRKQQRGDKGGGGDGERRRGEGAAAANGRPSDEGRRRGAGGSPAPDRRRRDGSPEADRRKVDERRREERRERRGSMERQRARRSSSPQEGRRDARRDERRGSPPRGRRSGDDRRRDRSDSRDRRRR
ncbi:hypothetical protein ABPG77_007877 [Micractinium sp. CCAP 211/92]